ncbi:MAG: GNAT family N-acetyltransferase [Dehalococcoidia bacterium]
MVREPTTQSRIEIVPAREEHVPFIAWVQIAAARSHLERGAWDLYIDSTEAETLRFLETLATTETRHFAHYTNFIIAQVEGEPAAALSGYFDAELGLPALTAGIEEANRTLGRSPDEDAAGWQRAGSIVLVSIEHEPGAWIVEWVATRPEFRRRGLVDRLLSEMLQIGRGKGAATGEIGVLIGNDGAQRAYEKAGFALVDEKCHPEFEAAYGCPGVRLLRQTIPAPNA